MASNLILLFSKYTMVTGETFIQGVKKHREAGKKIVVTCTIFH